MKQMPKWCACGKIITYAGETRCEDCWADDQKRYHGYSRAVRTLIHNGEEVEHVPKPSPLRPTVCSAGNGHCASGAAPAHREQARPPG